MSILEIKQTVTREDKVEQSLTIHTRTGELTQHIKQLAIMEISGTGITIMLLWILYFFIGKGLVSLYLVIFLCAVFGIRLLFNMLYIRKHTVKQLKKVFAKYYKDNPAQQNLSTCIEKVIITDDYLEYDTLGMTSRLEHKDFINTFETDLFYVLEYTHFHYAFIKKDAVQSDAYRQTVQFIQEKKQG